MNYAILRIAKRSLPAARAMAAHALRERPTINADPERRTANRTFGANTAHEAHARLRDMTAPLVRRRDAVRCIELFIGMSPEAARAGGVLQSQESQRRYFAASLDLVARRFGGRANVVLVAEHRDETTPHLQILLAPIERDATGQPVRLAANAMIGGPVGLQDLQDEVGRLAEPFGLRRGERGSRAQHTSIRSFYGAIEAAGKLDALPARVRVPAALPPPEPPGRFASASKKREYAEALRAVEQREAERRAAQQANAARQGEIERLAKLGLAVHGRGRRRLPQALSEAEKTIAASRVANEVIRKAGQVLDRLTPQQQTQAIEKARQAAQMPAEEPNEPAPVSRSGLRRR